MKGFLLLSLLTPLDAGPEPFKLKDGDRVVFVGSTLIEREQRYGYWETELTAKYPDQNITFRNLGWSGDTVWGEARAGFDTPAVGYKRLVDQTLALKPTVIILGYGTNESFAGKEGLERFQKQLEILLDDLAPSRARLILLTPPLDTESFSLTEERAKTVKLYADTLRQTAEKRQALFVDQYRSIFSPWPVTDNGMHLSPFGYWVSSGYLFMQLKTPEDRSPSEIELTANTPLRVRSAYLPCPPEPSGSYPSNDVLVWGRNLKPGTYTLKIDGRPHSTRDAQDWMKQRSLDSKVPTPAVNRAEKLRQAIVEKNQHFFHRYRPQNETYLFGFRKHEQGQNAKEIPQFDPLIEKLEKEIARLRVPVEHTYELVPASEEKK